MAHKKRKIPVKADDPAQVEIPPTPAELLESKRRQLEQNECGEADTKAEVKRYRRRPGPKAGVKPQGRPPKGPASLRPAEDEGGMVEVLHPDQIIPGDRLNLLEQVKRKKGEGALAYLERVSPNLVEELVSMAMSPVEAIHPRIKLDIIKELLQRPLPTKTLIDVHSTVGSEVDRMTDLEVYKHIKEKMRELEGQGKLPKVLPQAKEKKLH